MVAEAMLGFWGIVRRNWWIVVLAAAVGAVVAVAASAGTKPVFTAKTNVAVSVNAVNAYPQLPRQDALIAMSTDKAFGEGIAERLGVPAAQVAGAYRVYSTGNPQNQLWISFAAPERGAAEKGAQAVSEQLLATISDAVVGFVTQQRDLVKADEAALAALGETKDQIGRYYVWSVQRTLLTDRETLRFMESAYTPGGPITVASSSRRTALVSAAAGGALAGLFLGIVLVAVREGLSRRRRGSVASA